MDRQDERTLDRRRFLKTAFAALTAAAVAPGVSGSARAAGPSTSPAATGPYGPLVEHSSLGLLLPAGFTAREVARSGTRVAGSRYTWHKSPDGGATFPTDDGGWIYVSNSERTRTGGAGALRFAPDGSIRDAYRICERTSRNCAGGPTPWGTWLSCEEHDDGRVWECDPTGRTPAVVRPALGTFEHEAVTVDPVNRHLYLTEDKGDGRLYRFRPESYPDLGRGALEVAAVDSRGAVTWLPVPDPSAATTPTRRQVRGSTAFKGGEGIWHHEGLVYFTTKHDNRVWSYDVTSQALTVVYDAGALQDPPLTGVDNVVVSSWGTIVVAEDGGNLELVSLTPDGVVAPLVRVLGQEDSELTGPAFDPSGTRLYFSSQRAFDLEKDKGGITYEVSGPFAPHVDTSASPSLVDQVTDKVTLGAAGLGAAAVAGAAWCRSRQSEQNRPPDGVRR